MINGHKKYTGFIMLHRSIQEHWIWEDPVKLKWWMDILMTVNHAGVKVNIGFELMECNRGQSLNSLQTWAKKWRVDVSTVRRFFKLLQDDKMIITENVKKTTRLTVCNYDTYNSAKQAKQSKDNLETISKQFQDNTNNNVLNNDKNEKECVSDSHTQNFLNDSKKNVYTENDHKLFEGYQLIVRERKNVAAMDDQLTIDQFFLLTKKFPSPSGEKLFSLILDKMDNWKGIQKRKYSVYQTMIDFIESEKIDQEIINLREACVGKKVIRSSYHERQSDTERSIRSLLEIDS